MKNIAEIMTLLNKWMKSFEANGFVVGVSGGVDSAVVSRICAETELQVTAVTLPLLTPEDQETRAMEQINYLKNIGSNTNHVHIDLTKAYANYINVIPESFKNGLSLANIKSRLRMTTLYAISNSLNYIVAGTGNMVEDYGIGYFTKYGDGGVDISPIGGFTKTEVYQIAEYFDIPKSIREAAPTDGLWPNSPTDEERIGITYKKLENAMAICNLLHISTVKEFEAIQDLINTEIIPFNDVRAYLEMHEKALHKMEMPPVFKRRG